MALQAGAKLGPYEIVAPAGAGGMGEVYRARDTRLDRTVAIKVLPEQFSHDADLKQRFEREARAISSLNHPNICHLYDVGHQDGTDYLVMEYIEGESLADRLMRGALPLEQALKTGIEIADALDKAHRQGIVHRDLKPGNVMLTKSGAKLLDFGLAKPAGVMRAASSSNEVAVTASSPPTPITQQGHIVGTFQYMAPEQVEGKEADARSDIFALGAVLYEMATGKRAFEGKSAISIASAILEKDPEPISKSQPLTPPAFEHVVRRALEKDADRRWQSAADLAGELRWIHESDPSAEGPVRASRGWRRQAVPLAIATAILALAVALASMLLRPQREQRVTYTSILAPDKAALALIGDFAGPPVISPDGENVVFSARDANGHSMLWLRRLSVPDAHPLPDTEGAIFPFWAPDSRSFGFFADGQLKITDVSGRVPMPIASAPGGRGGSWSNAGEIIFEPDTNAGLVRVAATGGAVTPATKIDASQHTSHRWPFFLPDGKHFLYLAINHDAAKAANDAVFYASVDGSENRKIFSSVSNAIYADGYLLFARGGQLLAQEFDAKTGTLKGEPRRLADNVANDATTWHMDASASSNGLLVLGSGGTADLQLVWVDRSGKQLGVAVDKLSNLQNARLSPQGDRIAVQIDTGTNDIWVYELGRQVRTRLTFGDSPYIGDPVWAPDGKSLAYDDASQDARTSSIYRISADGSGSPELLFKGVEGFVVPVDWSSDGKCLLFTKYASYTGTEPEEIWCLPLEGGGKPFLVVNAGLTQAPRQHRLSRDGRWLAYTATEAGQTEVFVMGFGSAHGKWQVSPNGGSSPFWSSDGKELFYIPNGQGAMLNAVSVTESGQTLQFGPPHTLFNDTNSQKPLFDVAPDGKKFLDARIIQQTSQPITLISNWTAELRK